MTLVKRANRNFPTIRTRLSDMFDLDNFFNEPFFESPSWVEWRTKVPATNIKETNDAYVVEVAAPGLEKMDFMVNVDEGVLEIKVEKEQEDTKEQENYTRREYSYTNFSRKFTLPDTVDGQNIKARYENGVLDVTLPKRPEAKKEPRKSISID